MRLDSEELEGGDLLIRLAGRMDIAGAGEVDLPFAALVANRKGWVIADVSGVDYLASLGIRTFIQNARALAARGGRLVLAGPPENVRAVLDTVAFDAIIPIFDSVDAAQAARA